MRHGLLQIAAAGHRRVAVTPREVGERSRDRVDVLLDQRERVADLHDGRGVGDVLRGGAPVAPFAEAVLAQRDELLHHRQHRIADALGLLLELREVELIDRAVAADLLRRFSRDDAEARLHARERRLDVEVVLDAVAVGEDAPHRLSAEDVAKDHEVERGRRHAIPPSRRRCGSPPPISRSPPAERR